MRGRAPTRYRNPRHLQRLVSDFSSILSFKSLQQPNHNTQSREKRRGTLSRGPLRAHYDHQSPIDPQLPVKCITKSSRGSSKWSNRMTTPFSIKTFTNLHKNLCTRSSHSGATHMTLGFILTSSNCSSTASFPPVRKIDVTTKPLQLFQQKSTSSSLR